MEIREKHDEIVLPRQVGGSRLWNDQYIRDHTLTTKLLYSLHDYVPGMPVDLEYECELMKLHPFVHNEIQFHPQLPEDKHAQWNLEGTVNPERIIKNS